MKPTRIPVPAPVPVPAPSRRHALARGLALAAPFAAPFTASFAAPSADSSAAPPAAQASATAKPLRAAVEAVIRPLMARHDVPGMSVGVTIDGVPQVFHFGVASKDSQVLVTSRTVFEIGSISKMFTATLAAYAQATGQLSLADHPSRHLPQLKGRPIDQATLLHLGTYTAGGLPLQFPDGVRSDDQAMAYLQRWKAEARPGTVRQYSNPSIGLLGAATAAAMKGDFTHLVESQMLPQFGMAHTHIRVPPQAMPDYAWGHRDGQPVRVNPGPMDAAAYGIKTTAADLLRFVQAQIDPSGLPAPWRRAVQATQVGHFQVGAMVQGLGWEQMAYPLPRAQMLAAHSPAILFEPQPVQPVAPQATPTPRLFNKTGSTGGFGAYVAFVPARRIGLVMLANRSHPIAARVEAAHEILQRLRD